MKRYWRISATMAQRTVFLLFTLFLSTFGLIGCERSLSPSETPFFVVVADQETEEVPNRVERASDFRYFHLSIFDNLGDWSPSYMDDTQSVLRKDLRLSDADATLIFSALRQASLDALCSEDNNSVDTDKRFERLAWILVSEYRSSRNIDFLNDAVSFALELDESEPWNFKPEDGWCAAGFTVEENRAVLKKPHSFLRTHEVNRNLFYEAVQRVSSSARSALDEDQSVFAFGSDSGKNDFFELYHPVTKIGPSPEEKAYLHAEKLDFDGETVSFASLTQSAQHAEFLVGNGLSKRFDLPKDVRLGPGRKRTFFYAQRVEECDNRYGRCHEGTLKIDLFDSSNAYIKSQKVAFNWEINGIERTNAIAKQITDDLRFALVTFSGHKRRAGIQSADFRASLPNVSILQVIDLDSGEVVNEVKRFEGNPLFASPNEGEPSVSAAIFSNDEGESFLLVGRPEGSRSDVAEIVTTNLISGAEIRTRLAAPINVFGIDAGFLYWVLKGHDPSRAVSSCGRCQVIGLTPDQRYWIMAKGKRRPQSIVIAAASNGKEFARFDPYRGYSDYKLFSEQTGRLVVRVGSETQVYYLN